MKYDRYHGKYWKVYLMRFKDKETGQFKAIKPGHTKFKDAEDRMNWNHKCFLDGEEPDSFKNHYHVKCIWSLRVKSIKARKALEGLMLAFFGDKLDLGFYTSGYSEVRSYNQKLIDKWLTKPQSKILKWAESFQ